MKHLYDQIDRFHLLDIKNATHPSMFVEESNYDILILALPTSRDKELKIDSYAFVFDGTSCYWYDKNVQEFIDFKTLSVVAHALLRKENRARRLDINQRRNKDKRDRRHQATHKTARNIHQPLDKQLLGRRKIEA